MSNELLSLEQMAARGLGGVFAARYAGRNSGTELTAWLGQWAYSSGGRWHRIRRAVSLITGRGDRVTADCGATFYAVDSLVRPEPTQGSRRICVRCRP